MMGKKMSEESQPPLSHLEEEGRIKLVDVGAKPVTARAAESSGYVRMAESPVSAVRERRTPKGDPLVTARLAGIMAAKRTGELIPLCHPLALTHADVPITLETDGARTPATATTHAT